MCFSFITDGCFGPDNGDEASFGGIPAWGWAGGWNKIGINTRKASSRGQLQLRGVPPGRFETITFISQAGVDNISNKTGSFMLKT